MSLDNFSNPALEKALELIRMDTETYVNPKKVSVVVKNNYFVDNLNENNTN